jgi:hypothetical protein
MPVLFNKGFKFKAGELEYEKITDDEFGWWVATNSKYLVQIKEDKKDINSYELHPESNKLLYDEHGKLQRFGFRWTDDQIRRYYNPNNEPPKILFK